MNADSRRERLQRTRQTTQQAIRESQKLMKGIAAVLEQSQESYRASKALLEELDQSPLNAEIQKADRLFPSTRS